MSFVQLQNAKIVATVGPASEKYKTLASLAKAGVAIFRINFSHGSHEEHEKVVNRIQKLNKEQDLHVGIIADLQGPKLRIGNIENDKIHLSPGDIVKFTNRPCLGNKEQIYMSYEQFATDVEVGEKVLLDDGKIILEVVSTDKKSVVELKVNYGGVLSSNKGVNLPDTKISLPCLTEKDQRDLEFILTLPVHWIALSFVRRAEDIEELKEIIEKHEHPAKVVAKIEKPEAVDNIKSIIKVSDAIMIARGDLGVEMPIEKIPSIQKQIIKRCIQNGRPVIVATQMMESMIRSITPSRAEVTDVANAIHDGTDAVMLSGETSVGDHPIQVVEAMVRIIKEAEKNYEISAKRPKPDPKSKTFLSDVMCINAAKTAEEINAIAIVSMTASGYTAFKISSYRPKNFIYIFSDRHYMLSCLNLVWGVRCFYYDKYTTTDETINDVCEILKEKGLIKTGDIVVNTGSMPIENRFRTNMMKVTIVE